jgi:hypothetical protein
MFEIARAVGLAAPVGAKLEVLAHGQVGKNVPALGHVDQPAVDDRLRAKALLFPVPLKAMLPDQAGTSPESTEENVVLPTPLDPSSATISPSRMSRSTPRNTSTAP